MMDFEDYKGRNVKEDWLEFFGEGIPFPRKIGIPDQFSASSMSDFMEKVNRSYFDRNLYTSIHSEIQIKNNFFNKFYCDFDTCSLFPTLSDVWKETRKFCDHMRENYGFDELIFFTGGGFHVYYHFDQQKLKNFNALKLWLLNIEDEIGVSMDTSVLGQRNRLARLPYTWNLKDDYDYAKMCIPVSVDWDIDKIILNSENGEIEKGINVEKSDFPNTILKHQDFLSELDMGEEQEVKSYEFDEEKIASELASIMSLTNHVKSWSERSEPEDDSRFDGRSRMLSFLIVPRLVSLGMKDDDIIGWCENWIRATGKPFDDYLSEVEGYIQRTREGTDNEEIWYPWGFKRFFADVDHSDITRKFQMLYQAGVLDCDGEILKEILKGGD